MAAAEWDLQQLQAIARWYGTRENLDPSAPGREDEVLKLDPASTQGRILQTLQDLFENKSDAQKAAENLASLILSEEDAFGAWNWMTGCICTAAEHFFGENLVRLADLLVCLARLPHALPTTGPGDPNAWDGSQFADLPEVGPTLREYTNGPEQYICHMPIVTATAAMAARERWRNINAFCAILAHSYSSKIPRRADFMLLAQWNLAHALEYEYTAKDGEGMSISKNEEKVDLYLPAATQWILIAGEEVFHATSQDRRVDPGPLWALAGGGESFDLERWRFWQHRFMELAKSDVFDSETIDACRKASDRMAIISQG